MEEYIADLMSYRQLQEKVLKNEQNIAIMAPDDNNTLGVVVPDMGSYGGNPPYVPGKAGLVNLYNRSSGLELDSNGRLIISRASNDEVIAGISNNNPIVPATIALAMQSHSYKGDISQIDSSNENTPPSAKAVKDFVNGLKVETFTGDFNTITDKDKEKPAGAEAVKHFVNAIMGANALDFKTTVIAAKDTNSVSKPSAFEITPGMFAIVVPYGGTGLKFRDDNYAIIGDDKYHGLTILYAADKGHEVGSWDGIEDYYRMLCVWIDGLDSDFHHHVYKGNCYVENYSTTGAAYVFYINRRGVE